MQKVVSGYKLKIIKAICSLTVYWMILVLLSTSTSVRNWLAVPLVVHDENARGNACYVLAGGGSFTERLAAGADLIQMGRVSTLLIMQDNSKGSYSFKANSSWTRTQWAVDYLAWRGIPGDRLTFISATDDLFGTLKEARAVAKHLPKDVKTLVVVSSAPHMRRTVLAFKRSLPEDVKVVPFAATSFKNSYEMYHPIWIEYLKLLLYYVIA
ncbi:MAG: YdcF family protein [Geobacteraceae bacterium]